MITLDVGSSRANHTGAWRTERPVYVHNLPPCNNACPAGENIQQWLYDAEEGPAKYEAAWRQIMQDNPFPAVMGRVCYRPCETACNRSQLDSAVGINSVERFLGDEALRKGWQVPVDAASTGKRVLVVGAGPSGLSAAYHLARMGHSVTIKDAGAAAGGMMRYGIPKYRLPRDIMDAEITRILDMGITLELNTTVTDIQAELDAGYDAAFVAVGAHIGRRAYIPATVRPRLETARRIGTFDEVTGGLDESTALYEARRCMSCGNCFGCDNCYGVCPDNAIVKLGDGQYEIDYDYCKGCGLCVAECPCGAIEMEPEPA